MPDNLNTLNDYLPSHVENTSPDLKLTGNYYADKLVTEVMLKSKKTYTGKSINTVRENIFAH